MKTNIEKLITWMEERNAILEKQIPKWNTDFESGCMEVYSQCIEKAKSLSQESDWVKASERLPIESGKYFCKVLFGNGRFSGHYVYEFNADTKVFIEDGKDLHTGSVVWLEESINPTPPNKPKQ